MNIRKGSALLTGLLVASGGLRPAPAAELPVPCAPCNLTSGPLVWVSSGQATLGGDASHLVVTAGTRDQPNVVLNWQSFNISADGSVQFVQPGATAIALNRIFQADPSRIFGALTANGQVYLINQNGIVFGNPDGTPMQVNANALVASTLPINANAVANGILAPIQLDQAAFTGTGGSIQVNSGATIRSADGGRIALFSPSITNAGHIDSPDGQVILGAGKSIYLQSSDNPDLRGLLVEVDQGGTVANSGQITSAEGNITLIGLAINQSGRVSASTSVTKAGSVALLARDTVSLEVQSGGRRVPVATQTGTIEFAPGSVTEVALDGSGSTTAIDDQPQPVSSIQVDAAQIHMDAGSSIVAHGGQVSLTAELDPQLAATTRPDAPGVSVLLDAGSSIDVSGETVDVAMERNQVTVQLRGNELRDDPQQRDGILRGQTVVVDARVGTPLADVSGYIAAATARTVQERLGNGGTVAIRSQGSIALAAGSTINLSGGAVNYLPGEINTTKLIAADGQVYDIGNAPTTATYVGLYGPAGTAANKWGVAPSYSGLLGGNFVPGYTQGLNAGSLQLAGRSITLEGNVLASTHPGLFQVSPENLPLAGQLVIGLSSGVSPNGLVDYLAPSLWLGDGTPTDAAAARIPVEQLNRQGIGRFALFSDGTITLPSGAPLALADGTRLALTAPGLTIASSIIDHGGTFAAQSSDVDVAYLLTAAPGITVGPGLSIDVSGLWTNDFGSTGNPSIRMSNGGAVSLVTRAAGGQLVLGDGLTIDASGGGYVGTSGTLVAGNGGSINLASASLGSTLDIGAGLTLRGYALVGGKGGSLSISAPSVAVSGTGPSAGTDLTWSSPQHVDDSSPLLVDATQFGAGGFASYSFNADHGDLVVADGTRVDAQVANRQLLPGYLDLASGSPLTTASTSTILPAYLQQPASLTLSAIMSSDRYAGKLSVGQGAAIAVQPGGSITLQTKGGGLYVDGSLTAHGGAISLSANQFGSQAFDPAFSVWIGQHALLDASGTAVLVPDGSGNDEFRLFNAGTISATSGGYLVTEQGSLLDVRGAAASGDQQTIGFIRHLYDRTGGNQQAWGTRGGSVALSAGEGAILLGSMQGRGGTPDQASAEFGLTLDRALRGGNVQSGTSGFPTNAPQIVLASTPAQPAAPLAFGSPIDTPTYDGLAVVSTSLLTSGGFDAVNLKSNSIHFDNSSPLSLSLARQIVLNAQAFVADGSAPVQLAAPSVVLQSPTSTAGGPSLSGLASVRVSADNIDLVGATSFSRFGNVELDSRGDIRLRGVSGKGSLMTNGVLTLQANRIFPATMTSFALTALDPDVGSGSIQVRSNGSPPPQADGLLSAGGTITLTASIIDQDGVLEAPLGSINLNARDTLTLGPDSVTSVHATASQILLGRTVNLADWYYSIDGNAAVGTADQLFGPASQAFPSKSISLAGKSVSVLGGAVVDYSGGGDAVAWEQIAGPGGSIDALSVANAGGMFAILPASAGYGPVDPSEFAQWGLAPGAAVTLFQPAGNLAAGTYAILPPRYALLPGAFLVKPTSGFTNMDPGQVLQKSDGSTIVAGIQTYLNTGLGSGATTGYQVYPGSYAYQLAEYHLTSANSYLPSRATQLGLPAPVLPQDAGALSIAGQTTLDLEGAFKGAAAAHGNASSVDISATNLEVVTQLDPSLAGTQLTVASLEALDAGSLLLGGKRKRSADGTTIDVQAQDLTIANGVTLSLPELILVGRDSVTVGAGSTLAATGSSTSPGTHYLLSGDSARLLLSNTRGARFDATYGPSVQAGVTGVLQTQAGSTLSASGSLLLDGAKDLVLGGQLAAASGSTVSLASSLVTLGDGAQPGTGGLILTTADLGKLANVDLTLRGRNGIDIVSTMALSADNLTLDAPVIVAALGTDGSASLSASRTLAITNTAAAAPPPAQGSGLAGSLSLSGSEIDIDGSTVAIEGFADTRMTAASAVVGKGTAALRYQGNLEVTTPMLTLANGANLAIGATDALGAFRLDAPAGAAPADNSFVGGSLKIAADTIEQQGNILVHSGTVALSAADGVTLAAGSSVDVSGIDIAMPGTAVSLAAGSVAIRSDAGNLVVQSGATVDVSGSTGGGNAGQLALSAATGSVEIDAGAQLKGGVSVASARSADFTLVAPALAGGDFTGLNALLNGGSFNGLRDFHFTGAGTSATLASGTDLDVRGFRLVVDGGGITIADHISVDNPTAKAVLGLYAAGTVHVAATAALSTGSQAAGTTEAEIDLYSANGGISVDSGASLASTAPNSTLSTGGGIVHYRLSQDQLAAGALQVAPGAAAAGTRQVVEGYKAYDLPDGLIDSEVAAGNANPIYNDAATFMASAQVAALQASGFEVMPGVELTSQASMSLLAPWNLAAWRFGGEPGVLTIRTPGDLVLGQSLSDGFATASPAAALLGDHSWSYDLVAGANLASADPMATQVTAQAATLAIGPDVLVRTGTGDIHVASAGDVALLGSLSFDDPYAQGVIYTAGRSAGLELDRPASGAGGLKYVPVDGGALEVHAGHDIIGSPSDQELTQFFVEWYLRQPAHANQKGGIWIDYSAFQQQFAAMGGGDLTLAAGHDLVRVEGSTPSAAYVDPATSSATYVGSGSLVARAGNDIASAQFFVSNGHGEVTAGGALTGTSTGPYGSPPPGLLLAAMNTQFDVRSRGDALIAGVINPTSVSQVNQPFDETAFFLSYSPDASISVGSVAGNVTMQGGTLAAVGNDVSGQIVLYSPKDLSVLPANLSLSAATGDINLLDSLYLAPAAGASLTMAAEGSIRSSGEVSLGDVSPAAMATLANPDLQAPSYLSLIHSNVSGTSAHAVPTLHTAASQLARIVAATGDINGGFWFINQPTLLFAGRDVRDLRFNGQNAAAADVTRVVAGRDIVFGASNANFGINLDGPGKLDVVAGRNIDLGPSYGIVTEGNLVNPGLADDGAGITVMAGIANDIDSTLASIPADKTIADLFLALRTSGRDVAKGLAKDFKPGFDAIDKVFPASGAGTQQGNLTMIQSRIYTLDGGDINLVVPHGEINVGTAQGVAAGGVTKLPSQLGIVAEKAGAVRAFVDGDFLVNSSRVFTLGGGDILIWSSKGNIDAGRGAKTTISAPEPTITIDPQGNVQQNFGAAIAGSGIRGILAVKGVAPGDVDLYAPNGFVSAGDAGIGSAGNVTIAAVRVIGADNINFGGVAVGVPVDTGGLGASLASVSAASSSASNAANESAGGSGGEQARTPLASEALSWLEVFVLGLGEDNCRPDDLDCLKRQKKIAN